MSKSKWYVFSALAVAGSIGDGIANRHDVRPWRR